VRGAPIATNASDLSQEFDQLLLELLEPGGPLDRLRPGINGSITVYIKASAGIAFVMQYPDLD